MARHRDSKPIAEVEETSEGRRWPAMDQAPWVTEVNDGGGAEVDPVDRILTGIGALVSQAGLLLQQQRQGTPTQQQKLKSAKDQVIGDLEATFDKLLKSGVSTGEAAWFAKMIGEAIGGLRACNTEGMTQAWSTLSVAIRTDPLPPKPLWDDFRLVSHWLEAFQLKQLWDAASDPTHKIWFDEAKGTLMMSTGAGRFTAVLGLVHRDKTAEAWRLAQELHDTFSRCDYMSKEQVRRTLDLASPG